MADQRDTRLGQLAITKGFVSASQVKQVIDLQEQLRAATGRTQQLGDLLLEKGLIDQTQLQALLQTQVKRASKDIGGFTLISRLGAGGMGAVYKAKQKSMDRMVALKVLPPKLAKDQNFIERFFREARSVARLNHPNIVQGIDVGEASGYFYFAMEFVEGSSLRDLLEDKGQLSEQEALDIVEQVSRGLHHAHAHGLIHRDIKPDNVLIDKSGVAKVCDLGLARQAKDDSSLTQTGVALGTPHYISPEQARGEADVDARTDLYSLGATWFHLLAGSPPFMADNPLAVITKHLTDPAPKLSTRRKGISRGCEAVIAKLMSKDPADRYQSAEDLLKDIADLKARRVPKLAAAGGAAYLTTRTRPVRARGTRAHPPISSRLARQDLPDGIDLDDLHEESPPKGPLSSKPLQLALAAGILAVCALGTWGIRTAMRDPQVAPPPTTGPTVTPPPTQKDPQPEPPDPQTAKDRLAELERMHQHILATRKEHPDDLDLLEKRWLMLRKAGQKTKYSLMAMDELNAIAAKRRALAALERKKLAKRFEAVAASVDDLLARKLFGTALGKCRTFAGDPAAAVPEIKRQLSTLRNKVEDQGRKAVAQVLSQAKRQAADRKFPDARKTLEQIAAFGLPHALPPRDRALADIAAAERTAAREKEQKALDGCRKVIAGLASLVKARQFGDALQALDKASKDLPKSAADQLVAPERELLANAERFMTQCIARAKSPPADLRIKMQGMSFRITKYNDGVLSIARPRMESSLNLYKLSNSQALALSGWGKPDSCTPVEALATGCFLALSGGASEAQPFLRKARSGGKVSRHLERALAVRLKGEAEVAAGEKYAALQKAFAAKRWRDCVSLADALLKDHAETSALKPLLPKVKQMREKAQDEISPLVRYCVVLQQGREIPLLGIAGYSGTSDTNLCGITKDQYPAGRATSLKAYRFGAQAALYRFDLSLIPPGARIERAVLEICCRSTDYGFKPGKDQVAIFAMNTPWQERDATWSFPSRTAGTPWKSPGAKKDFDTTTNWGHGANGKVATFSCDTGKYSQADITPLVTAWVTGRKANRGVYLKAENNAIAYLYAKEADAARRPKLTITFKSKRIKSVAQFAFHPKDPTVYTVGTREASEIFKRTFRLNKFSTRRGDRSAMRLREGQLEFDVANGDIWLFWAPTRAHGDEISSSFTIDLSGKRNKTSGHVAFGYSLNNSAGIDGRSVLFCRADGGLKTPRYLVLENMIRGFRQKSLFTSNGPAPKSGLFGTYHFRFSWRKPLLACFVNGRRVIIAKLAPKHAGLAAEAKLGLMAGMLPTRFGGNKPTTLKITKVTIGKPHDSDFKTSTSVPTLREPDLRAANPRPPRRRPGPTPPPVGL